MRLYAAGRPGTLRHVARDEDGVAADVTGSVAVSITDDAGEIVQSGNAVDSGVGVYTLALNSAIRGAVGRYEATWTYTQNGAAITVGQEFEVVSDWLFDIAELRDHDISFEDDERYTADMVRAARDAATERLENAAQVAFVQRARRVVMSGNGMSKLVLPDTEVISLEEVWVDGEQLDETAIDLLPEGVIIHPNAWTTGTNNIELRYVHGYTTPPEPVRRAALTLASEYLVVSALPARATAQSTDLGEFRITIANVDAGRDTGIPEVDAVIARFGRRRPVIG